MDFFLNFHDFLALEKPKKVPISSSLDLNVLERGLAMQILADSEAELGHCECLFQQLLAYRTRTDHFRISKERFPVLGNRSRTYDPRERLTKAFEGRSTSSSLSGHRGKTNWMQISKCC